MWDFVEPISTSNEFCVETLAYHGLPVHIQLPDKRGELVVLEPVSKNFGQTLLIMYYNESMISLDRNQQQEGVTEK